MFNQSFRYYLDIAHDQAVVCLQYAFLSSILSNDLNPNSFYSMRVGFHKQNETIMLFMNLR